MLARRPTAFVVAATVGGASLFACFGEEAPVIAQVVDDSGASPDLSDPLPKDAGGGGEAATNAGGDAEADERCKPGGSASQLAATSRRRPPSGVPALEIADVLGRSGGPVSAVVVDIDLVDAVLDPLAAGRRFRGSGMHFN